MKRKKDTPLIKCINIIINLTKNKEIKIKNNCTINFLEKEFKFKLKKQTHYFYLRKTLIIKLSL